jgi:hypothetical protein
MGQDEQDFAGLTGLLLGLGCLVSLIAADGRDTTIALSKRLNFTGAMTFLPIL